MLTSSFARYISWRRSDDRHSSRPAFSVSVLWQPKNVVGLVVIGCFIMIGLFWLGAGALALIRGGVLAGPTKLLIGGTVKHSDLCFWACSSLHCQYFSYE
jgi:hypothetical protein